MSTIFWVIVLAEQKFTNIKNEVALLGGWLKYLYDQEYTLALKTHRH